MKHRWLGKALAGVLGAFIGFSITAVAQIPGPVPLRGTGGDSVQQIDGAIYGSGGAFSLVPNVGTGGDDSYASGNFTVHVFNNSGTFVPPLGVSTVEVLVVGGGGGGGRGSNTSSGGGGGGGQVLSNGSVAVVPTVAIDIVVGGAGLGATTNNVQGQNGGTSIFNANPSALVATQLTAIGGGGGGGGDDSGLAGASGGGAGSSNNTANARVGGTGSAGGDGGNDAVSNNANNRAGGGGGGAGGNGGNASNQNGGAGGAGSSSSITGSALFYGAGGGGASANGGAGGSAGVGGDGGSGNGAPGTPLANRGGGGGGTRQANAGNGAAGVVIVRYATPAPERAVHVFTSTANFTPPEGLSAVDVFMVGGGGSGGKGQSNTSSGGGGGAGAVRYASDVGVTGGQSILVTVGSGGAAQGSNNANGATGGNSVFNATPSLTAVGGGGGSFGNANAAANNGGSGGGAGSNSGTARTGGTATAGQGNAGGSNFPAATSGNNTNRAGGGGGGAGSAGSNAVSATGGAGGAGVVSNVTGSAVTYAAGGGGAGGTSGGAGGSSGIGGAGGANDGAATAGLANTGSGGGGVRGAATSGAGASGIVVVTYIPPTAQFVLHAFTSSGTFRPPPGVSSVELLVVGGGGGGGSRHGGGGGGGGVVHHANFAVGQQDYAVVVGAGGTASQTSPTTGSVGTNGGNSSFGGSVVALGGGGGGSYTAIVPTGGGSGGGGGGSDNAGGSGDGAGENRIGGLANQANSGGGTGYGNAGGNGAGVGSNNPANYTGGGGGGGAGSAGGLGVGHLGGAGGNGYMTSFTGTIAYFGGGGGGGSGGAVPNIAAGGLGGGGNGGSLGGPGAPGTANTGGGGGGSRSDTPGGTTASRGGAGGSGVVYVRYRAPQIDIVQQPSAVVISGNALAQQPQIRIRDYLGNPVSGVNVTSAIDAGTATLGGTTTVATGANGIATFTNLALTGSANTVRLGFTAAGANPAQKVVSNDIALRTLHLEITHATTFSVCSPSTPVTVSVRDSGNTLITDFAGTVTLANSSGQGTFSGAGVTDLGNGQAQYTFTGSEGGQKVFNYSTTVEGSTTFNATSGSLVTQNYALTLDAGLCRIRIAFPAAPATTCAAEDVTFTVVNAAGATLTDFAGTLTLATSTGQGGWANGNGNGTFTPGPGDGTASYTFGAETNPGSVTLQLLHPDVGTVNIDANYGVYTDAPGFDPDLTVNACSSGITMGAPQCYNNATNGNVTIVPRTTSDTRMVVLTVGSANAISASTTGGAIAAPNSSATVFNGTSNVAMTLVDRAFWNINGNTDVRTEMWAILDANLAADGGNYNVAFNGANNGTAPTTICVFALTGAEQEIPPTPTRANNTEANGTGAITTAIDTSPVDDSMVISAVAVRKSSTTSTFGFGALDTDLDSPARFGGYSTSNLGFGGSYGVDAVAGALSITENLTVSSGAIDRRAHVVAAFRPDAPKLNHFRVTHNGSGGTCAPNAITITAVDQYGATMTGYTGTVTLGAGGAGSWSQGTATNAPVNGAPGAATYTFHANDAGSVVLTYATTSFGLVDIDVSAGLVTESPFFDVPLNVQACEFRIMHAGADGSTCAINTVTLGVYTPGVDGVLVNYTGSVTLNTVLAPGPGSGGGDWSVLDGDGSFDNGIANDGAATYQFHANDGGQVVLGYSKTAASTVNFNPVATGLTVAAGYDANLVLTNCFFRISHDGNGDVCTPELVTISVVNGTGVQQQNYVGNLNLTTPTGSGDWSVVDAANAISNFGSGAASYTFAASDGGDIQLHLRHHAKSDSGFVIGANSGSFGVQSGFNPTLTVAGCTIRFSIPDASSQTCSHTDVTVGIYDSSGALATAYSGAIALSTSTTHGTWLSADGPGALSNSAAGTGVATYTFTEGDGGDAVLRFSSDFVETLNFNANSTGLHPANAIVVDTGSPAYDPDLTIGSCLPEIDSVACYPSSTGSITLKSSAQTSASRMLLVYVGSESTTPATGVTVQGQALAPTLLRTETVSSGGTLSLQVYGLRDQHLPSAAGNYTVSFTGSANSPAMCIVSVVGVAQTFPQGAQLNGAVTSTTTNRIETALTVPKNNSLVVGVALSTQNGTNYYTNLDERMWAPNAADPNGADWVGDYEYHLVASGTSAIHQNSGSSTGRRQAQIALVLDPVDDGPPGAGHFVPVTLFETFSGRLDYVATGNSLRADGPDFGDTVGTCEMPEALSGGRGTNTTGTSRVLPLPANATVKAAYLYWAGSGTANDVDATVRFGLNDGVRPELTADRIFLIKPMKYDPQHDPIGNGVVSESYFAAYKDVTGLVTNDAGAEYRVSDLTVRVDSDWATWDSCVAGWALVVVYEHALEDLNVINLFHGFQPFWHSSLTLIPRNFRMATPDGVDRPHAQVTHVTYEGDADLGTETEVLGLQDDPAVLSFKELTNTVNPLDNQYNETVSYPNYNGNLDFTGTYTTIENGLGVDVDTYYVEGDDPGEHLYEFGSLEAEQITTHYETGQDIVLLGAEFISVMNSPIADLEVFVADAGNFKVGLQDTAQYQYSVTNNGDGADGGFASGDVILTGNMPTGITIDSIAAPGWDCSRATSTAFTCVFDIAASWTTTLGAAANGKLAMGETLPLVTVTLDIANQSVFPLLDNSVTTVARLAHVGNYYLPNCEGQNAPAGVQPNPNPAGGCSRAPEFDNKNDLNKFLIDIDDLAEKSITNNNVHHNERNVRGIETNLGINKALVGILEASEPATYQITVTNLGPDATTVAFTVSDTLPPGLVPLTASGTDWNCPPPYTGRLVTCTRSAPLAVGATTPPITIVTDDITAPAVEGQPVSNTATVQAGQYNFDNTPGNDFFIETAIVTGPLAASTEKFLLSVSEDGSTIGGLPLFDAGDLVLYDPVTDTAEMFLDQSAIPNTNAWNVDALHLLPNGHVIMSSTSDGAMLAGVTFDAEDLVLYDPLTQTATLVFDGSQVFSAGSLATADIDAVHVVYNNSYDPADWHIVFSTTQPATIGGQAFQNNDIVRYVMGDGPGGSGGVATVLKAGSSDDLFGNASGDIGALHIRYDDANKYILSTSDSEATISPSSGETQAFERGELIEVDLTTPGDTETDPLFCDDVAPCEGAPPAIFKDVNGDASATRRLDAVHVIESGYIGHFSVSSSGGDVCTQTLFTIRKHAGLSHVTESHYTGSIIISNSLGDGTWVKDPLLAHGTLTPLGSDSGRALYTFAPADNGQVSLYITDTSASNTFNVDVRSAPDGMATITRENAPSEDPNIVIGALVTPITYGDQFGSVSYSNNDGVAGFSGPWIETNDDNDAANGRIRIASGQLRFNGTGGAPALTRQIDFSSYTVDATPTLSFNWTLIGAPTGTFVAEARGSSSDGWTQLWSTTATSGSGTSGALPLTGLTLTSTTQIRFRIASGYNTGLPASQYMAIDNVQVSTETHDCGVGGTVDHYAISFPDGATMVSCMVEYVTITPHSGGHLEVEPGGGTTITLQTSTNKGFWGPPIGGLGTFSSPVTNNGYAQYTYVLGESALTFPFYYTDLSGESENVLIQVSDDQVPASGTVENSTLAVSKAGLLFYNESDSTTQFPTLVSGVRSSAYPQDVLVVQAVRANADPLADPLVCENAFDDGEYLLELAFECVNPDTCGGGPQVNVVNDDLDRGNVTPVPDNGGEGVSGPYEEIPLLFTTANLGAGTRAYSRAQLVLTYPDAGSLQIHGRYRVAGDDDDDLYIAGSGDTFVVRPFGYDIDVSPGVHYGNGANGSSWAPDADGSVFIPAGTDFSTNVRAVAWDEEDAWELDVDGILRPVAGADLSDNATTPNYGNENGVGNGEDAIGITARLGAAMDENAVLENDDFTGGDLFTDFANGVAAVPHNLRFDEVGIIDLIATLESGDYLGGGESVTSELLNVGRFYPANFRVTAPMLTPRPLFAPNTSAPFTYMGEQFSVMFTLTTYNALGTSGANVTKNYSGDFAKLASVAGSIAPETSPPAGQLAFYAVENGGSNSDVSHTTRLSAVLAGGPNPFEADYQAAWDSGSVTLDGNLVLARRSDQAPDGPFGPVQIAVRVRDTDGVVDAGRTVTEDVDACNPDCAVDPKHAPSASLIGTHEFRYGRIRLENAYGSEIADLDAGNAPIGRDVLVRLVAEYFDGTSFVPNEDDNATTYDSVALDFVPGSYTDGLDALEAAVTSMDTPGIVYRGETMETQGQHDVPMYLRAPGEGNAGTAVLELDLDALGLGFLTFDWRDAGELEDVKELDGGNPADDAQDFPRALIEFGTFRGNDRIINWQELFE